MSGEWPHIRLRFVAQVGPATPVERLPDDEEVSFLPLEAVWPDSRYDPSRSRPLQEVASGYTRFREGDVLVPKITPTFEAARSAVAVGLRGETGFGTTELHVLRPGPRLDGRFLWYRTLARDFVSKGTGAMVGVAGQKRVPSQFIKDFELRLPPLGEQCRIVADLDRETARIDALLEGKRRLLALLDEKRTALIEAAVAEGWPRKRLRFLAALNQRQLGADTPPDLALRYMDISSVDGDGSLKAPKEMRFEAAPSRARRLAREGDTAISTVRTYLKAIAFVNEGYSDCVWSTGFAIVSPGPELHPRFLYYVTRSASFLAEIERRSVGISYPAVNVEDLADISCPVPPLDDQRQIAAELDEATGRLGELAAAIGRQIGLLDERRKALITATVNGERDPSADLTSAVAA
jgi:type I restriction enzyme S subunit